MKPSRRAHRAPRPVYANRPAPPDPGASASRCDRARTAQSAAIRRHPARDPDADGLNRPAVRCQSGQLRAVVRRGV